MNRGSVFELHKRFKEGRESVKDDERCGRSKEVRTPELGSHWTDSLQGILCRGFKGVQEEISSEEASTLQIGSVAFPPGQCTSPQANMRTKTVPHPPYSPNLAPCDFGYSQSSETVVMRQLRR